jgi:hypothetical protein
MHHGQHAINLDGWKSGKPLCEQNGTGSFSPGRKGFSLDRLAGIYSGLDNKQAAVDDSMYLYFNTLSGIFSDSWRTQ